MSDKDKSSPYKKVVSDKARNCLRCNKPFPSTGPNNRICPKCSQQNISLRTVSGTYKPRKGTSE